MFVIQDGVNYHISLMSSASAAAQLSCGKSSGFSQQASMCAKSL